jgi:hypothetical protein
MTPYAAAKKTGIALSTIYRALNREKEQSKVTYQYRTPDGKMTSSVKRYVSEWNAIKEPLEAALDLRTIGFDPGFLMTANGEQYCSSVDIPVWLAKRIVAAIAKP